MFGDPTENPNGWIKLTVKDAVTQGYIARPLDGNHGEKHPKGDDYVPEGVPFLMAQDLIDKRVDFNNCHFITEKQASTLKKGWAKEGDVLLTHKGTIGRVAIVQPSQYESMLLTPQITYYRCLKDIDNEYLAAYFMTGFFVEQLERLTTGTTRACVTITQQERLELIIPPVSMQRDFVKFVNQSDKSKFTGFKSQFIEMFGDPVRNDKEWPTKPIKEVAPETNADIPKDNEYWWLNLDMIESYSGRLLDRVIEKSDAIGSSTHPFDDSMVLYSKLRPYLNKIFVPDSYGYATTELVALKPNPNELNKYFLFNLLRGDCFVNFANKSSSGAQMPRMQMKVLREFQCILPPMDLQNKFVEISEQADKSK